VVEPGNPKSAADEAGRLCVFCEVTDVALVLGSAQPASDADLARCSELGVDVTRRRCGGGAVIVRPRAQLWLDAFLPAGDPLFDQDVGRSFRWLGEIWADALAASGAAEPTRIDVTASGQRPSPWARRLCFGSLGAGEVTIGGRKVVGIAQRRTRDGSWFHSMAPVEDTASLLVDCLALSPSEAAQARQQLEAVSAPVSVPIAAMRHALVERLG
jgi:lipoate-protein ligase A